MCLTNQPIWISGAAHGGGDTTDTDNYSTFHPPVEPTVKSRHVRSTRERKHFLSIISKIEGVSSDRSKFDVMSDFPPSPHHPY